MDHVAVAQVGPVVVVGVYETMAQQRRALLDVLVPVVVERDVGVGRIIVAGADQARRDSNCGSGSRTP